MFAETPRRILLVGALGESEIADLIDYCDRVHAAGRTTLQVDMEGVTDCGTAGLDGLVALVSGSSPLTVTVQGARWGQFMMALGTAPMADVERLCDAVRGMVDTGAPGVRARGGKHRQTAAADVSWVRPAPP